MRRLLAAVPVAALGLLAGHQVSYERVAQATGPAHASMLTGTQSWLPGIPAVLLAVALAALMLAAWAPRARRAGRKVAPSLPVVLAVQVGLFAVMEVSDRVLNGCCPLPEAYLIAGSLAAQLPWALAAWALLAWVLVPLFERVLSRGALSVLVVPAHAPAAVFSACSQPLGAGHAGAVWNRGPPAGAVRVSFAH